MTGPSGEVRPRWALCPSTHCERRQECSSPHECSAQKTFTRQFSIALAPTPKPKEREDG